MIVDHRLDVSPSTAAVSEPEGAPSRAPAATYAVYGVRISSPLPLSAGRPADDGVADIRATVRPPRRLSNEDPPGSLILDATSAGHRHYAVGCDHRKYCLRITNVGDLELDLGGGALDCTLEPGIEEPLLEVLLTGMVPALWLYLNRTLVLHAAAVTVRGRHIALCGGSGMGKSTLASFLCREGATLIGDDVLGIGFDAGVAFWYGGCRELRLRYPVADLASEYLAGVAGRPTADGRLAVAVPPTTEDRGRLDLVVVPVAVGVDQPFQVARVAPVDALGLLARFPRLAGWSDSEILRSQFEGLATLVESVPVVEVRIPWRLPMPLGLTDLLWPHLSDHLSPSRIAI